MISLVICAFFSRNHFGYAINIQLYQSIENPSWTVETEKRYTTKIIKNQNQSHHRVLKNNISFCLIMHQVTINTKYNMHRKEETIMKYLLNLTMLGEILKTLVTKIPQFIETQIFHRFSKMKVMLL